MSEANYAQRPNLSEAQMKVTIDILAEKGITVLGDGKLDKDKSVQLYPDGHLYDFGFRKQAYNTVDDFISARGDINMDTPVQVKSYYKASVTKTATRSNSKFKTLQETYSSDIEFIYESGEPTLMRLMNELLPEDWFKNSIPDVLGYRADDPKTLTVSAMEGDEVYSIIYRNDKTKDGRKVKWKARSGSERKFTPFKFTGKDEVYLASGMGELVMLEALGVDYICLQMDGAVKHLTEPSSKIKHLIILPDNDKTFMDTVPDILTALNPERASMVKWEHTDPREGAMKLETMEAFMTEVTDNLEDIAVPEKVSYDLDFENVVTDKDDDKFAETFADIAVNEFGFTPYEELIHNWKVLSHTLNKAMMTAGASSALTMGAGEGKSTGTALFIARNICNNDRSAMIVVNLLSNGREVVENINKWSGTTDSLLVDGSMKDTDTTKVKVLVITHAMLKATLYGNGRRGIDDLNVFNGKPRDLIVIDEAIDLRKSHTVTLQHLDHLNSTLSLINTKKTADIRKTVKWFIDIVSEAKKDTLSIVEKEDVPESMTADFTIARALLKSRYGSTPDPAMGLPWNKVIDDVEVLISSNYFTVSNGNTTYISTATDYMPKETSIVILDASADIDEIYYQYKHKGLIDIVKTRNARNFNNATLYARQVGASKYEMLTDVGEVREDVLAVIEAEVYEKSEPSDKILIISHKKVREEVDLFAWKDRNVITMNWGDITGRNDARDCNKVFLFGLSFKPRVEALNKMYAINGNTTDKYLEGRYRNTDIISALYQAIMRASLRVPQDDHGCIKTEVYITIPNAMHGTSAQLRGLIGSTLKKKLNGATLKEWEINSGGVMDTLFAKGTWFNTFRLPATKLSPTLKKMQRFLLNEAKAEKALEASKYHGVITANDMAVFIRGRNEPQKKIEDAIRQTLNRAGTNQLALLTGWTYGKYEVFSEKTRKNVKVNAFRPIDD